MPMSMAFCARKIADFADGANGGHVKLLSHEPFVVVERGDDFESLAGKAAVARQRLTDMSGSDQHDLIAMIKSQNQADFFEQAADLIPVALLPKPAEAIEVLSDLRGVQTHFKGQFPR